MPLYFLYCVRCLVFLFFVVVFFLFVLLLSFLMNKDVYNKLILMYYLYVSCVLSVYFIFRF